MKELFEQYGGVLITIVAILGLLAIIYVLMDKNSGMVVNVFMDLIGDFSRKGGQFYSTLG